MNRLHALKISNKEHVKKGMLSIYSIPRSGAKEINS